METTPTRIETQAPSDALKRFSEEVKSRVRIEDVAGEAVLDLKRSGRTMKGLCPFRAEKTPSFHVSTEHGFYRCFGCGAHGDVIDFVMEHEKIDFKTAVEAIAKRFSIPIPDEP